MVESVQSHPLESHFRGDHLVSRELALYLHIPFCEKKCLYCDFFSITEKEKRTPFVEALLIELASYAQNPPFGGFSVSTIYLGGGTPSLLSAQQLQKILEKIYSVFPVHKQAEITLEANPGALAAGHLQAYRQLGVNRLSLGIQSFHDTELQQLGRIHAVADAKQAITQARQAGFDNLSLDLIYAIPQQDLHSWQETLARAVAFHPEHLSCYSLSIEPATPLARLVEQEMVRPCDEELERELFITTQEILSKAGYEHYEISNYSRPGFRSQHNQKYWTGAAYLGLGPSAHSFDGKKRWWNVRSVNEYLAALTAGKTVIAETEELTDEQHRTEAILLGLRTIDGLAFSGYEHIITAMGGIDEKAGAFARSASGKLFARNHNRLALTQEGLLLYNYVCEKLCAQII